LSSTIRKIEPEDVESCGEIGYEAHKAVSTAHGYPSEQPSREFAIELIKRLVSNQNSWGILLEDNGKILGSIFLHKFPPAPVAVIGPLTVNPSSEGGVGAALLGAALDRAREQNQDQVRLVQSPSHMRSFALYTKIGFSLREPLFLMQGKPIGFHPHSNGIRIVQDESDISACNDLCKSIHGFSREGELRQAAEQVLATMVERDGVIAGYAAGFGLFGHAIARTNDDLKSLISSATNIGGPGFFVPARNQILLAWLLQNKFRLAWPANLITIGPYQEPRVPYLPSLAY